MPPKRNPSRFKRHFSHDTQHQNHSKRVTITFLLIDHDLVGIEIPYNIISADPQVKALFHQQGAKWDAAKKMWVVSTNRYPYLYQSVSQHSKEKQYQCCKIPQFVIDASTEMPLDLPVNNPRVYPHLVLSYDRAQDNMDPSTLPFYDKLYNFQKESLQFGIKSRGRLLLADEMGVGKTVQSLAIAYMFQYQWPMVIICPSTLRYNWQNEVLKWYEGHIKKSEIHLYTKGGATLREGARILIISYDLAWKYKDIWDSFAVVIADEAHYLKNSGCKRTDILVPLLAKKKRVILLTGTPAFARPREIYNMASIVRPDAFTNFTQFGNRYCDPTRNPFSGAIQYQGCKHSKELFFLLKDRIMIRRLKKEVLTQLPDKQRQKVIVETDRAIVKKINELMSENGGGNSGDESILEIFGYRGATDESSNDFRRRESLMEAFRLSGMAKLEGSIDYIGSLLENDVKLLIFAHHKLVLDRIAEALEHKKIRYIRIDGDVPMSDRQNRVDQFQQQPNIMAALLSISAAGVGLTLTASSTVIFAEMHWTPAMMLQAEDRAHRIGQQSSVNCHYLVGEGTLDSLLYNFFLKKTSNVSSFVDGVAQNLQMQEVSKGFQGKVSKNGVRKQISPKQRLSSNKQLKPLHREIHIQGISNNLNSEEATDISSDCSREISIDSTPSLGTKSRKRPLQRYEGAEDILEEQQHKQKYIQAVIDAGLKDVGLLRSRKQTPQSKSSIVSSLGSSELIGLIEQMQRKQQTPFYGEQTYTLRGPSARLRTQSAQQQSSKNRQAQNISNLQNGDYAISQGVNSFKKGYKNMNIGEDFSPTQ